MTKPHKRRGRRSRLRRRLEAIATVLDGCLQAGLILLLIGLPLARGGAAPWALPLGTMALAVLTALWLGAGCLRGRLMVFKGAHLLVPLGLMVVGLVQLIPAEGLVSALSPTGALRWSEAREAGFTTVTSTLSLAPRETLEALWAIGFWTVSAFLMANAFASRAGVVRLTLGLVGAAFIQALVGFWPQMMNTPNWYWYVSGHSNLVRGTFTNRNHFACMMGMGATLGLGVILLMAWMRKRQALGRPVSDELRVFNPKTPAVILMVAAVMVIGSAQVLSLSRGGTISTAIGLLVVGLYGIKRLRKKWQGMAWGAGVLAIMLAGASEAVDRLSGRYEQLVSVGNLGMLGRMGIWKDTLRLIADYWATGVGLGAFGSASLRYETGFAPDRISVHAHNDWLQLIAEIGFPLAALTVAAILWLAVITTRRLIKRRDPILKWLGVAAVVSCAVVALHELVEFNLHLPGTALMVAGVVTVALLCARLPNADNEGSDDHDACMRVRLPDVPAGVAGCIGVASAVAVVYAGVPYAQAGRTESKLRMLTSAPVREKSRMETTARNQYFLDLANTVLAVNPHRVFALYQRAENETALAQRAWNKAIAEGTMDTVRNDIAASLDEAVADMRAACQYYPSMGYYQAICAQAVEQAQLFTPPLSENAVTAMFDLAHANSPNLGKVTYLCANGAWRRYLRSLSLEQADEAAREKALTLYGEAIKQSPNRASDVFAWLWPNLRDAERLREITPNLLISHEHLFTFLLERGRFEDCHEQLQTLKAINKNRQTVEDDAGTLDVYDMGRISKRSREDVAASLLRREAFVLGMIGRWNEREQLIAAEAHRLIDAQRPRLERVETLMAASRYVQAEVILKRVLQETPGYGRAWLTQARLLRASGRHLEAVQALAQLIYRNEYDPIDHGFCAEAVALAKELQSLCRTKDGEFPIQSFVSLALQAIALEDGDNDSLTAVEHGLAELSGGLAGGRTTWTQGPFVHYVLGRVRERLGDVQGADAAYDRALKECPSLWYALRRRTGNDGIRNEWTAKLDDAIPLQTDFGGSIRIMGYQCLPPVIDRSEAVTIRYQCLCLADVTSDLHLFVRFRHAGQTFFTSRIKPGAHGRETLGWKVGEWITLEHTIYPARQALESQRRLATGRYDLEIQLVEQGQSRPKLLPTVPARGPAFEVKK